MKKIIIILCLCYSISYGQNTPAKLLIPVEFIKLEVHIDDLNKATLTWYTASEKNNDKFILEKGYAYEWKQIAVIRGAGNSKELQQYDYTDEESLPKDTYYRLVQYDFDGNSVQLAIIKASPNKKSEFMGFVLDGEIINIHYCEQTSTIPIAIVVTKKRVYKIRMR